MSWDPRIAYQDLNGDAFTVKDLRTKVAEIRVQYASVFPAEVGVNEMMETLHQSGWLYELNDGRLLVSY